MGVDRQLLAALAFQPAARQGQGHLLDRLLGVVAVEEAVDRAPVVAQHDGALVGFLLADRQDLLLLPLVRFGRVRAP